MNNLTRGKKKKLNYWKKFKSRTQNSRSIGLSVQKIRENKQKFKIIFYIIELFTVHDVLYCNYNQWTNRLLNLSYIYYVFFLIINLLRKEE